MRALVLVAGVVACGPPRGPVARLPEPPPVPLADTAPSLAPGERTAWNVFYKGLAIGRAELAIGPTDVRTSFRTGTLASALRPISYQLVTTHERGRVRAMTETLVVDGKHRGCDATIDDRDRSRFLLGASPQRVPGGTSLHTLHSALGVVRAWARPDAPAGYLWLLHQGALYRLDVFRPARDEALGLRALRVDGVVRALAGEPPMSISVWLAANRDRTPLRFVIDAAGERVQAEVVESTAAFD